MRKKNQEKRRYFVTVAGTKGLPFSFRVNLRTVVGGTLFLGFFVVSSLALGFHFISSSFAVSEWKNRIEELETANADYEQTVRNYGRRRFEGIDYKLQFDTGGKLLLAGENKGRDKDSMFLRKTVKNGAEEWERTFGTFEEERPLALLVDSINRIWVLAESPDTEWSANFDGLKTIYLFDERGNQQMKTRIRSENPFHLLDAKLDDQNELYIAGYSFGNESGREKTGNFLRRYDLEKGWERKNRFVPRNGKAVRSNAGLSSVWTAAPRPEENGNEKKGTEPSRASSFKRRPLPSGKVLSTTQAPRAARNAMAENGSGTQRKRPAKSFGPQKAKIASSTEVSDETSASRFQPELENPVRWIRPDQGTRNFKLDGGIAVHDFLLRKTKKKNVRKILVGMNLTAESSKKIPMKVAVYLTDEDDPKRPFVELEKGVFFKSGKTKNHAKATPMELQEEKSRFARWLPLSAGEAYSHVHIVFFDPGGRIVGRAKIPVSKKVFDFGK